MFTKEKPSQDFYYTAQDDDADGTKNQRHPDGNVLFWSCQKVYDDISLQCNKATDEPQRSPDAGCHWLMQILQRHSGVQLQRPTQVLKGNAFHSQQRAEEQLYHLGPTFDNIKRSVCLKCHRLLARQQPWGSDKHSFIVPLYKGPPR